MNKSAEIKLAQALNVDWGHMGIEKRRELIFKAALKRIEELEGFVKDVQGLMGESSGIAGFHLNGSIAAWDEVLPEIPILAD